MEKIDGAGASRTYTSGVNPDYLLEKIGPAKESATGGEEGSKPRSESRNETSSEEIIRRQNAGVLKFLGEIRAKEKAESLAHPGRFQPADEAPQKSFSAAWKSGVEQVKRYPVNLVFSLVLALWTQAELFGTGSTGFMDWKTGTDPVSAIGVVLVLWFGFLRLSIAGLHRWWLALWALVLSLLLPLWAMMGWAHLVSPQNFDTLLATDAMESWSFLKSIPWEQWSRSFGVAVVYAGFVLVMRSVSSWKRANHVGLKRWKKFALVALLYIPFASPLVGIGHGAVVAASLKFLTPPSSWHVTGRLAGHVPAQNYILIMGESLSNKVMGLYGAPFATTPYLSSVPTRRIEHFIAPNMATAISVPLYTALQKNKSNMYPAYENNLMALAKEAGFETYWLSAQGAAGAFESRNTFIANQAMHQDFSAKHDDFKLLSLVQEVLKQPAADGKPRFIMMHTYGAHEEVCDRVTDVGLPFKSGVDPFVDCYLAAALKADKVIAGVMNTCAETQQTCKVIFTSDHAINMKFNSDGEFRAYRDVKAQGQYEVPFVELGQGVTKTEVVKGWRSGLDFPAWMATWLGLKTNLTKESATYETDFPKEKIQVFNGEGKLENFSRLSLALTVDDLMKEKQL